MMKHAQIKKLKTLPAGAVRAAKETMTAECLTCLKQAATIFGGNMFLQSKNTE